MQLKFKVFYGWWIVAAYVFIALSIGGVLYYGFTAFFEPIATDMGWSYTQISLGSSLRGFEVGLLAPLVGILVDRWGPRKIIFIGVIILTTGLILLSYTTSLSMYYGAFAIIALGSSCCGGVAAMTAVANWFQRKIGIASGIAMCGWGLAGLLVPLIVYLIGMYGWHMSLRILAIGILVTLLPLSLVFRHRPEQYGYLPDGQVEGPFDNDTGQPQAEEVEVTTKQALKSSTFWYLMLVCFCCMILEGATITHLMPYLSSIGIPRSRSSLIATAIPLTSIVGRLGFGWLRDKINTKVVAVTTFLTSGLGLLCFGYIASGGTWLLVPFVILFGIGYGGFNVLRTPLVREHFGRAHFATISGLMWVGGMFGGVIAPPLAGWVYDNWGSYNGIWFVFAGAAVVASILILRIPSPKHSFSGLKSLADENGPERHVR